MTSINAQRTAVAGRARRRAFTSKGRWSTLLALIGVILLLGACTPSPPLNADSGNVPSAAPDLPRDDSGIRLNQIQLLGSHNSYHVAPSEQILGWLGTFAALAPGIAAELGDPALLNYTHPTITTQLERGLRTFELDVFADSSGGRFAHPLLPELLNLGGPRPTGMDQPGMKVLHIQDIDFMSRCPTLIDCLTEMRAWSDGHPGHLPVIINVELKDDPLPDPFAATAIEPFDAANMDRLDAEIRSVLGDRLLTPDDVRGDAPDLRTALADRGWPTLRQSRGRFLFFMDNANKRTEYLAGHPSLAGRVMFTSSGEGQPDGAILKVNDPGDGSLIRSLVEAGYIVRTRADDDVTHPKVSQRDSAFASGAQVIHSDFPQGQAAADGYTVSFGTSPAARCNPVNTSAELCRAAAAALRRG